MLLSFIPLFISADKYFIPWPVWSCVFKKIYCIWTVPSVFIETIIVVWKIIFFLENYRGTFRQFQPMNTKPRMYTA